MLDAGRLPSSLLFYGPVGVGKATLARKLAAALLGDEQTIERDDLSRPENQALLAERDKLSSTQRAEEPLVISSHPDFLTFPPDGPLRQITIQQMRLLKEQAQLAPMRGRHRIFLVDQADRANEQAANSLLKVLEEPPPHLTLILTAENYFELLPTIRSRVVAFYLAPLSDEEVRAFAEARGLDQIDRRTTLAAGCPGRAVTLDLAVYDQQRETMLAWLEVASGARPFTHWARYAEQLSGSRADRLEPYLEVLHGLLEDVLWIQTTGTAHRNHDIVAVLTAVAERVDISWLHRALNRLGELERYLRRNIQKSIGLDALVVELRRYARDSVRHQVRV